MSKLHIRVIEDPPLPGADNMARDEALLVRVGLGDSPPTLRFYQWAPPTVSLGYFQEYRQFKHIASPAGALAVVRRLTGGGAILHDRELTYSLSLPLTHLLAAAGPIRLYDLVHDALIDAIGCAVPTAHKCEVSDGSGASRGPFFCFERRHRLDVMLGFEKLAGSAQRRTRLAVLQHGSIVLERRFQQQRCAALNELLPVTAGELAGLLVRSLGRKTGVAFSIGEWHGGELAAANALIPKYAGDGWTRRT